MVRRPSLVTLLLLCQALFVGCGKSTDEPKQKKTIKVLEEKSSTKNVANKSFNQDNPDEVTDASQIKLDWLPDDFAYNPEGQRSWPQKINRDTETWWNPLPRLIDNFIGDLAAQPVSEIIVHKVKNAKIENFLNGVVQRLTKKAPQVGTFRIYVTKSYRPYAFTTSSGVIYVSTGLLLMANSESEMAGVIGHEIAHTLLQHVSTMLIKLFGTEQVIANVVRASAMRPHWLITEGTFALIFFRWSRGHEHEADMLGIHMAHAAGYEPRSLARFFESLIRYREGDMSYLRELVAFHPSLASRIEDVEKESRNLAPLGVTQINSPDFRSVQIEACRLMGPRCRLDIKKADSPEERFFRKEVTVVQ